MSGRLDGLEQGAEVPASPAPERDASADPDLPQDPGIPGPRSRKSSRRKTSPRSSVSRIPTSRTTTRKVTGPDPKGVWPTGYFASEIGISTTCVFDPSAAERS